MRLPFVSCLVLLAALRLAGDDTIKIGEFASLTGKQASFGQTNHRGAVFAVEEINAAGGVLGRKLQLEVADDASGAAGAQKAFDSLIYQKKVDSLAMSRCLLKFSKRSLRIEIYAASAI